MTKNLQLLRNSVLLGFALFMLNSGTAVLAQTEITVDGGFNTLLDAVNANPGATLILLRGEEYIIDQELLITVPTIIKGEKEPAATRPALITFYANPGEGKDKQMFNITSSLEVSDVATMGITSDGGEQQLYDIYTLGADYAKLILDRCYIQGAFMVINNNYFKKLSITQKNCQFMNMVAKGWDNGGIGMQWAGDSIDFKAYNNTYFVGGRGLLDTGAGPDGTDLVEHNSYVATWGDTFFPNTQRDITIKNNIFYDSQVRAYVGTRKDASGVQTYKGDYSDWTLDSLCGDISILPHLNDSVGDPRVVNITNNLKMYSKQVMDFYAANNVTPQPFLPVHDWKFAEDFGWNIKNNMLQEKGSTVDPIFVDAIPAAAYELMFKERVERSLPVAQHGEGYPYYYAWFPNPDNTIGIAQFVWPFPVNLKPTNPAVLIAGDDGYPLGDLNWFGPQMLKDWEDGKVNSVKNLTNKSIQTAYISNDILRFKGFDKAVNVEVYSILGQKVLNAKNINELNVSSLKTGVYLVRVNNGSQAFKVTK